VTRANAATDEPASYEALYRTHYARVLRLCRLLLHDAGEAEDVAQEVFLKLLQASRTETRPMAWGPWLTRVAVNACRDRQRSAWWQWWRRVADGPPRDADAPDVPSHRPTPEEEALWHDAYAQIWRAFRGLPARQREAVVLRYVEGWSTEAIADALGVSVGSVKQHLFRAVQRLRRAIGGPA
jgi:RNA polymerase sigma-70 factor (ECF subfamily)